jgi:putative membrane-bound dehydrogenase-like protein
MAQGPAAPKPPIVNDPALKIELVASYPEVEACTTVCGAPDGSIYVGNDPRDGRLSTSQPVNTIIRLGPYESPDLIVNPDGKLAPPVFHRKRTVFADKLYSPAGSAWHDGYLYVLHDPLLTRFKDTDGDGIADVREDLVTNLGIPPNEGLNDHVVSGFTLGMDGFFYISVGDRGIFEAKSEKDGSTITMRGGGIVRCRTDGTQLEIFSTGSRNHLQVNLDAEDNAFTRDNTDDGNGWWSRLTHHIEGGYYGYPYLYRTVPNYGVTQPSEQTLNAIKQHGGTVDRESTMSDGRKVADVVPTSDAGANQKSEIRNQKSDSFLPAMADFGGGSPTGGLCYLSDGLPEQYRGKHFFSEWGKAGVFVTEVARDGATFKLVSDTKLVEPDKGGDFRPMQLSVAADGSLLIADWGYGGWKSPKVAGAIWRLSWPEAKPAKRIDEGAASVDELVAALGHPDRDQRLRAQFALLAKFVPTAPKPGHANMTPAGGILKKLAAVVKNEGAPEVQRIHAIRTAEAAAEVLAAAVLSDKMGTMALDDQLALAQGIAASVAKSPNAAMRRQAARAMRRSFGNMKTDEFEFDPLLRDADASVRAEAARSLGRLFSVPMESKIGADLRSRVTRRLLGLLVDPDGWVRFTARRALARMGDWKAITDALGKGDAAARAQLWLVLDKAYDAPLADLLARVAKADDTALRSGAVEALGRIAYQPQPYDGHWWGTQPVKSPPPPNSVAWVGTPTSLAALTAALADADTGVRLAAAKAFTAFTLGGTRSGASQTSAVAGDQGLAGASPSEVAAAAALRVRLTAESDAAIRRQIIESLGAQKDPQAMEVFRQIALGDPDMAFRETAIGAVVNIGGDAAKKTIAQLADAKLSPAATRKVITAAGELKVLEAAPALIAHLKDEDAGNREFAARSLQQLGPKSGAGPALIEAMADKEGKVQAAAVDALGSYREKAALPGIIALLEKKKHLRETTGALVLMPDESAIPVLVETLRDKNTTFRRNAIKALKTMREKAWPQVEALLASGRMPEELVPEIRSAFESGAITKWKMVGVFENVWEAQHPPEKDVLAMRSVGSESPTGNVQIHQVPGALESVLAKKYHNAEGNDVGWIDVTADGAEGRVDLEKVFKTNAMVCAYAFTEIDAPQVAEAKLFTSADDELAIWLNGQQILNQPGSHGYEPDKNETRLQLAGGKNQLFVKIGNKSGPWVFHARMPGFDNGKFIKSKEPAPDEKQRTFALAAKPDGSWLHTGDVKNGEKLFFDQGAALGGICATCHMIAGKGGQIGPDLSTVGANYKRPDLLTSIHEPSKTIALGFEQVMLETNSGETVAGSLRSETGEAFTIVDAAGQSRAVKKADVKKKTDLHVSLMPPGLTLGLKAEEFVDLLAYLESLKGK